MTSLMYPSGQLPCRERISDSGAFSRTRLRRDAASLRSRLRGSCRLAYSRIAFAAFSGDCRLIARITIRSFCQVFLPSITHLHGLRRKESVRSVGYYTTCATKSNSMIELYPHRYQSSEARSGAGSSKFIVINLA